MMRTGWAAMRQKMTPWMLVEIISSDTPIIFSVLSAGEIFFLKLLLKVTKLLQSELTDNLLFYPEALQKWWLETRQRSRWKWWQRGPEGSEHQCSRWRSNDIDASGPSPSHQMDSLSEPEGPLVAPLEASQLKWMNTGYTPGVSNLSIKYTAKVCMVHDMNKGNSVCLSVFSITKIHLLAHCSSCISFWSHLENWSTIKQGIVY